MYIVLYNKGYLNVLKPNLLYKFSYGTTELHRVMYGVYYAVFNICVLVRYFVR